MSDLLWILAFSVFSAVWFVASGFLAYAWSGGKEPTRGRFHGLLLVLYILATYVLFFR